MIVKGLIKSIDYSDNSCMVRLPVFETAATKSEVVLKAVMLSQPGMYNGYAEGDVVFVDFENDKLNQPIIIGKLFLGPAKENTAPTALSVANLTVSKSATLPIDTKLVLEDSGGAVPVENGITSYKSLTDIIKALYKAESSAGQIVQVQSDSISNIKVEYLSQPMGDPEPEVDDERWAVSTPTYAEGMSIWQKTTCYNSRGQILNAEILCLSTAVSSASYRLRCSSRIHAAKNQAEPITIQAMVKLGTSLEVEDTSAFIGYSWGKDGTETLIKGASLTLTADQLQEKNLLVTFKHTNALDETKYDVYDTDTVMYAPLNTPLLSLSNDTDTITYAADGSTVLSSPVTSTAALYLNGDLLEANYSWELTNCSTVVSQEFLGPVTVPNTNTITIKSINSSTRAGTAVCTAVVTQEGAFKDKSFTKTFSVTQTRIGESATSYWLTSTCTVHRGTKHASNISITARKRYGISPEEVDEDAYLWWKYKSAAKWSKATPKHNLVISAKDIIDDTFVVVATHDIMFDPEGMSDLDLITNEAVYEMEEIPFSPLNTPIVNLTNDMAAIAYNADGSKLNDEDIASTTAGLYLNGSRIPEEELSYSWDLINCANDQGISGNGNITTPTIHIKTLSADVATATCTITYKEESYSKVFTVVKQIQGKSPYVIDIFNDFVTVPAKDNGELSTSIKTNLETLTTHTISCYHGTTPVTISEYSAITPSTQDKLFRVKYSTTAVTLSANEAFTGPSFAITDLSDTVGYITYELYQGKTRLASAKFEVSKLLQGESSINYWLKTSSRVHLGVNQQSPIEVIAMQKIGTETIEDIDENAQLYYRYKEDLEWLPVKEPVENDPDNYTTHQLVLNPQSLKNQDLIIKAVHVIDGTETEYETETITYSPLNTPILDLDNDTDTILYPAKAEDDYQGPLGDPVKSKAILYLNGDPLEASYSWTLVGCSSDLDATIIAVEGQEVTVAALSEDSGRALVTATVLAEGAFKGKVYSKTFTVSKTRKGDNGINSIGYSLVVDQPSFSFGAAEISKPVTITGTCYIHNGNLIQPFGGATYNYKIDAFDESDPLSADSNGRFRLENIIVESQVEVCLLVNGNVIDKELIRVIRDGRESASVESQTTYYALIHNKYTAGQIQAPTGDSEDGRLVREAGTGTPLNRLDIADTASAIAEATTWGPWSEAPPAHTENTNGWKYWTTIRTKFSNTMVPQYSIPITNEDLSSVYALAQGKTTNYYSPEDPSKHYEIKKGDCWFCTPAKSYTYTLLSTPSDAKAYLGKYVSPDASPTSASVYLEVTEYNLDAFLRGTDVVRIEPGETPAYARSEDSSTFSGGVLYQWNGEQWEDIGEELIANKITTNYINSFDITAKKLEVLDTDNSPLFKADGANGSHEVQLGGFNVVKNTLTSGEAAAGNLIKLSSDNTNVYTVGGVTKAEIDKTSDWAPNIASKWANIFTVTPELVTIETSSGTVSELAQYSVTNACSTSAYTAITKITFKQAVPKFTLYLKHAGGDSTSDYILASKCYPAGYTNSEAIPGHDGHAAVYRDPINGRASTLGRAANTVVTVNYETTDTGTKIRAGDFIYIVHIHAVSSTNDGVGSFYLPTAIRLSIGDKFQVLSDGTVYAKNLYLGTPADFNVSETDNVGIANADTTGTLAAVKLISGGFENKMSLDDDNKGGIYLGPDGLSIGTGFKIEAGGGARFSNAIREDLRGFSIVANVDCLNATEADWTIYGTTGHSETWPNTSTIRNGCRIGDMFTVTGTATDSGKAHVVYYRSTTASGNLQGECVSHSISERGVAVSNTTKYYKLSTSNLASDGNQPDILEPSDSNSKARNKYWYKSPATFTTGNYYESVRSVYADGSFEWSIPVKNSMLTVEFINSLNISAKQIEVSNSSGTLFKADGISTNTVEIADFTVNKGKLSAGEGENYVELGTEAIKLGGGDPNVSGSTPTFSVSKAGYLTAESGKIGGFDLSATTITGKSGAVGLSSDTTADAYAFWAGNADIENAPFSVTNTGTLTATSAKIKGHIDATEGTIGGFEITNNGFVKPGYLSITSEKAFFETALFSLNNDVTIYNESTSSYIATSGNRDFEIRNLGGAGIRFKANEADQNITQIVTITQDVVDEYKSSYGVNYKDRTVYFDYSIPNNGTLFKPEVITIYYKINVKNNPITAFTVTIPAGKTSGRCEEILDPPSAYDFMGISTTQDNFSTSVQIPVVNINSTNNILYSLGSFCPNVTGTGTNAKYTSYVLGDDNHVWKGLRVETSPSIGSDRRIKNSIADLSSKYDDFFSTLRPASFKYNNGDSGRTHTGFIAQEVEESLLEAGLSTQDFAGLCIGKNDERTYALRYEEFIALNTSQIQKLKKRVTEQETRIEELERIVKELQK